METLNKELEHKEVVSYLIEKCTSGIVSLEFTTRNKWIKYDYCEHDEYSFNSNPDAYEGTRLKIPEIHEYLKDDNYHVTMRQEQDKVTVLYIPFELLK